MLNRWYAGPIGFVAGLGASALFQPHWLLVAVCAVTLSAVGIVVFRGVRAELLLRDITNMAPPPTSEEEVFRIRLAAARYTKP